MGFIEVKLSHWATLDVDVATKGILSLDGFYALGFDALLHAGDNYRHAGDLRAVGVDGEPMHTI